MRNGRETLAVLVLASVLGMALAWEAAQAEERRAPSVTLSDHAGVAESSEEIAKRFGPVLPAQAPAILTRGCMDAAWKDGRLYVLSRGRLCIFATPIDANSTPVGEIDGLGNTRQIAIAGNLTAITSREDGLWLVDVGNPAKPVLLSHYDTIELATGIALEANVALVACRQYGVEQVNVSDPRRPRHLSTFRTGEAQSVFLHNGLACIGDWAPRKAIVCDVRDPWRPALVSHMELDGFGDGVFVRGNLCFAATGHHARGMRKRDSSDPAYGRGHGLEIFDISDPANPKLLSRTKLPRFYSIGYDMWDVQVSGRFAVVGDTHNGIYVFDISDLEHPVPVGHHRLPLAGRDKLPDAVGGFAIGPDCIYVAGVFTGLHRLSLPGIQPVGNRSRAGTGTGPFFGESTHLAIKTLAENTDPSPSLPARERLQPVTAPSGPAVSVPQSASPPQLEAPAVVAYRPEGQVHEVAVDATHDIWIAAGRAGLHRLSLGKKGAGEQVAASDGVVFSVDVRGNLLAAGEGTAGLSLWRRMGKGIDLLGRYQSTVGGIGQVRLSPDARYAILHAGPNVLEILDITSPSAPKRVLQDRQLGLFYRTPLSLDFLPDGRFGCLWHASGMYFFRLKGENGPAFSGWKVPGSVSLDNGMAVLGDRFLATYKGGYVLLDDGQTEISETRDVVRLPGHELRGKPTVFGTTLYVSQRWEGTVKAIDLADPKQPRLRWSVQLAGNPGPVQEAAGYAIIPAGYDGVVVRPVEGER